MLKLLLLFALFFSGYTLSGNISKISDGDTLSLNAKGEQYKIRLLGIDAPELKQSFGKQSRNHLLKLCPIKSRAKVFFKKRDKYGRILGRLECKNAKEVNKQMVLEGFAWAYREYSKEFVKQEQRAKQLKKGLWSEENPIYPQDFRKQFR